MRQSTRIVIIVTSIVAVLLIVGLTLYFTLRSKSKTSSSGSSGNGGGNAIKKTVGGWTEQDLSNARTMSDAKALALVTTKSIQDEPNFQFSFNNSTIEVTDLTTQVVNGTNYRIEYSIRDTEGDHVLYVTATLYRPPQASPTQAEVVKKDYALENINRPRAKQERTGDKNAQFAAAQPKQRFTRRRQGN